jgi:tetratricopeptide (TPR) repeat protein
VPKQRNKEIKTMIHLLENLAVAVAQAVEGEQTQAAKQVATELSKIKTLPAWLPETDFRFYLGLAQFYSNHYEAAETTLSSISSDSLGAAEAHWILIQILSSRLTEENAKTLRLQMFKHDQQIAHLYPYSPTVQYVANMQTEQREAALGSSDFGQLLVLPTIDYGRFYEWQPLVTVGDLYDEQNLFEDAANAYHRSIQVRDLDEWLESCLVAEMWVKIADCYEQERTLAARHLARSFALPLTTSQISAISARLKKLLNRPAQKQSSQVLKKPDAQKLQQIGDMLVEMEMFDEAVRAYRQAEQIGADMRLLIASALEAKAQFLFDYRSQRTKNAILFGMLLSWEKVAQAYKKAKQSYEYIQPQNGESLLGIQRCQEALAQLNPSQQRVKYERYNSRELLVVNE